MGYCNRNKVLDSNRKVLILSRPEEQVRQKVIHFLVNNLKFPKDLIVVERKISDLTSSGLLCPINRRIDILCYGKGPKGLFPLLLIECKADQFKSQDKEQLEGYNKWIGAEFVAIVSKKEAHTGFLVEDLKAYHYDQGLKDYETLLKTALENIYSRSHETDQPAIF